MRHYPGEKLYVQAFSSFSHILILDALAAGDGIQDNEGRADELPSEL